jgi:hypothetical protein
LSMALRANPELKPWNKRQAVRSTHLELRPESVLGRSLP